MPLETDVTQLVALVRLPNEALILLKSETITEVTAERKSSTQSRWLHRSRGVFRPL